MHLAPNIKQRSLLSPTITFHLISTIFFSSQDGDTEDDQSAPSLLAMSPAQSVILDEDIQLDQAEDCMSEVNKGEALVAILDEGGGANPRVVVQFRGSEFLATQLFK